MSEFILFSPFIWCMMYYSHEMKYMNGNQVIRSDPIRFDLIQSYNYFTFVCGMESESNSKMQSHVWSFFRWLVAGMGRD